MLESTVRGVRRQRKDGRRIRATAWNTMKLKLTMPDTPNWRFNARQAIMSIPA